MEWFDMWLDKNVKKFIIVELSILFILILSIGLYMDWVSILSIVSLVFGGGVLLSFAFKLLRYGLKQEG